MTYRKLTDRQELFVREYLVDLNGTQAAIRAGYARGSASRRGWALRRHAQVAARIDAALDARAEVVGITAERVLCELALLGFANIKDYFYLGEDGMAGVDPARLTRAQAAAITEVQVEDPGAGAAAPGARRGVRRVKIKLADKSRNLELIGRHLGLFARAPARDAAKSGGEQWEGVQGDPVRVMSDMELAQAILGILVDAEKAAGEGESEGVRRMGQCLERIKNA